MRNLIKIILIIGFFPLILLFLIIRFFSSALIGGVIGGSLFGGKD